MSARHDLHWILSSRLHARSSAPCHNSAPVSTSPAKPIRVAFLWPYYPPEMGAASNRGTSLAAFLKSKGCEVRVCAPEPSYLVSSDEPEPEVPVTRRIPARVRTKLGSRVLRLLMEAIAAVAAIPTALRLIKNSDVVVVSSPPLLFGLAGVIAARLGRKPVLLDVRDLWPDVLIESGEYSPGALTRIAAMAARLAYQQATAVSVVTRGSIAKVEAGGVSRDKIFLVPNGVENALVNPGTAGQFAAVQEAASRTREMRGRRLQFRLVYAGLLGPAQGVGALLDALELLQMPVRVDVVGEGSEAAMIEERAAALDVEFRFHGLVGRTQALEISARADAAFVPLSSSKMADTIPSKIFESMALGIPIVAVTSGEAARIIEVSGGGLVSAPGDVRALAANIETFAADRELTTEMGQKAREFVARNYLREAFFEVIYDQLELLNEHAAPPPIVSTVGTGV